MNKNNVINSTKSANRTFKINCLRIAIIDSGSELNLKLFSSKKIKSVVISKMPILFYFLFYKCDKQFVGKNRGREEIICSRMKLN